MSVENSLLGVDRLSAPVYGSENYLMNSTIPMVKAYTKIVLSAAVAATFGANFISLDPCLFFSFLNSIEIISYLAVYQANLHPMFSSFLASLRVNMFVPSFFQYIPELRNNAVQLTGKLNDFGDNTNLLLLNSGLNCSILLIVIFMHFLLYLVKKIPCGCIKKAAEKMYGYFKYQIYVRFWIQTFFDFTFNSFISVKYCQFQNYIQILDFVISLLMLVSLK